jgi:hypothetical protein
MNSQQTLRAIWWLPALLLAGALLRGMRLAWQPLWWDEGYSVYFATESLQQMWWLTAHNIHPPLYYTLLHGWLRAVQNVHPIVLRLFSVGIGMLGLALFAWFTQLLYPQRRRLLLIATVLLLCNPMHLFYSHEVRMYSLALVVSIASTACLWKLAEQIEQQTPATSAVLAYAITATLALYTLYYLAFLLLAHLLWALWRFRHERRRLIALLMADALAFIFYLPWLIYTAPKLLNYVAAKVPADADQPLGPLTYLIRHLVAFTAGHIAPTPPFTQITTWAGIGGLALLILATRSLLRKAQNAQSDIPHSALRTPHSLLWTCLLFPTGLAFLLNLNLPFFPVGGERLLLFVLPYFLLLIATAIDQTWRAPFVGPLSLIGLLFSAGAGSWTFYTTPRSTEHDYRPLIRQIVQQGADADTVLAIFPWQVGYWRAYASSEACPLEPLACTNLMGIEPQHGPHLKLLGDEALTWNAKVQKTIDQALEQGSLWFPAPLSFGSTLPQEIEHYLAQQAVNLENRWYSPATRLSAWRRLPMPTVQPLLVDFGAVRLVGAGVAPAEIASANQPVNIALAWEVLGDPRDLDVTLRLRDGQGHTWANRNYTPLGSLSAMTETQPLVDQAGLLIPVGLPPGQYEIVAGVVSSATQELLQPTGADNAAKLIGLTSLVVQQPPMPEPSFRLPIQRITTAQTGEGIDLLGYSGNVVHRTLLSGEEFDLTLFLQAQEAALPDRQLYVSLLDKNGAGVAGWEGWSPADWRPPEWPPGALVQAPVRFSTPSTLPGGEYRLIAGVLNPENGAKSPPVLLDPVELRRRAARFLAPAISTPLAPPVQFGTHAMLLGYTATRQADQLELILYWQVLQTLQTSHHIFVHLDTAAGVTLAQSDGPPVTADGPAPTGTWQPGEYLVTQHGLVLPGNPADAVLRVGLYLPETGVRLPASANGQSIGDAAMISPVP